MCVKIKTKEPLCHLSFSYQLLKPSTVSVFHCLFFLTHTHLLSSSLSVFVRIRVASGFAPIAFLRPSAAFSRRPFLWLFFRTLKIISTDLILFRFVHLYPCLQGLVSLGFFYFHKNVSGYKFYNIAFSLQCMQLTRHCIYQRDQKEVNFQLF